MDRLKDVRAFGGGDREEDWAGAIEELKKLDWRTDSRRGVIWLAGDGAHGHRFCGLVAHQEQEPRLENLVTEELAGEKVTFRGIYIRGQARKTFAEIEKIYKQTKGAPPFREAAKFQGSVRLKATRDIIANQFADFVTKTISASVRDFWFEPPSREPPVTQIPATVSHVLK